MPNADSPSDELRDLFRQELIREQGELGLSILGHGEELNRFRHYLETLEKYIFTEEGQELESLKAQAAKVPETRRDEFWAWHYPVHWDEIFRTNLRSSFLVSLVSFLEMHLARACRNVEIIARTPINSSALKGGTVERAKLFLTAFVQLTQPAPDEWALVERIYDVRNVFVHHAGSVSTYGHGERLRQFVRTQPGLREENGCISLADEFCFFVLRTIQAFLDGLATELAALCDRVRRFEGL